METLPRSHPDRAKRVEGPLNEKTCACAGDGSLRASCGLLALWSTQPLACAPHGREKVSPGLSLSALRPPTNKIPKRKPPAGGGFLFGAGDGSLRASYGLLALWSTQPLACVPQGREKAPLGLSLPALRLPSSKNPKRKPPVKGGFLFGAGDGSRTHEPRHYQ